MSRYKHGVNDLETMFPKIAKEWHPTLNGSLNPSDVHSGSSREIWWLCPQGHSYLKSVDKRTNRNQGCPKCRMINHSFAKVHPELLRYWDYEKNCNIDPNEIMYGSDKKVWWKCENGHTYKQSIYSKSQGLGCPYCSHQKTLKEDSLGIVNPEVSKQWNTKRNGNLTPFDVGPGSHKRVWWICPQGHEWQSAIYSRRKSGCPICDSEKRTSFPEQAIYFYLSKLFQVESRMKILGYEADIYCPKFNVAIEYDGEYFHSGIENDNREQNKNICFMNNNVTLIRVKETRKKTKTNSKRSYFGYEIYVQYNQDYNFIKEAVYEILNILNNEFNQNFNLSIDIVKDKVEILNSFTFSNRRNNFLEMKPLAVKKWDYLKNGSIDFSKLPMTSKKKYWWKCPTCGNEWYGSLDNVQNTLTCNKCVRSVKNNLEPTEEVYKDSSIEFRVLPKNLQTENPNLASQWLQSKNGFFKPINVSPNSNKRVWWKCPTCGYEWVQSVHTRNNGITARKCPICANNQKKSKNNSIGKFDSILYKEWSKEKNKDKTLNDFTSGSNQKVWWNCSVCGNVYLMAIKTRVNGSRCPLCAQKSRNEKKYKKVINLDTLEEFNSVSSAAKAYKISRSGLSACLSGKSKTCGGFRWAFIDS